MASPVRSSRRRKAIAARGRFFAGAGLVALAIAVAAGALNQRAPFSAPADGEVPVAASVEATAPNGLLEASAPTDPQRAVFPYSVVPGGVESVEELRNAIATDAVVADHYKGFDLSTARVERLSVPRAAHVSYRLGEHVYWTRKALVLPAGERVITDGKNVARMRCGNQVAADVPGATSPSEPAAAVLDTPLASRPVSSVAGLPTAFPGSTITPPLSGRTGDGGTGGTPLGGGPGGIGSGPGGFGGVGGSSPTPGHPLQAPSPSVEPCSSSAPCTPNVPPGAGPGEGPGTPGNGVVPPPGSTGPGTPDNRFVPPPSGPTGPGTPDNGFVPPPSGSTGPAGPDNGFVPPPSGSTGPGAPDNGFVPPPVLHPPFVPPGVTIPPLVTDGPLGPPNPPNGDSPYPPVTSPGDSLVPPGDSLVPPGDSLVPPGDSLVPPGGDTPPGPGIDSTPKQDVPAPIPEPGSMMLMLTGACGLLARRLRGRRQG